MTEIPTRIKKAAQDLETPNNLRTIKKWYKSLSNRDKATLDPVFKEIVQSKFGWDKKNRKSRER